MRCVLLPIAYGGGLCPACLLARDPAEILRSLSLGRPDLPREAQQRAFYALEHILF